MNRLEALTEMREVAQQLHLSGTEGDGWKALNRLEDLNREVLKDTEITRMFFNIQDASELVSGVLGRITEVDYGQAH